MLSGRGYFDVCWELVRPWEQVCECVLVCGVDVGDLLEQIGKIIERVKPVLLGRLDYAVNSCAGLCPFLGVGEHPVLSPNDEGFDAALAAVVIDLQATVKEEGCKLCPVVEAVLYGRTQCALWSNTQALGIQPFFEAVQVWFAFLYSPGIPIFRGDVLELPFYAEELVAEVQAHLRYGTRGCYRA